MKRFIYFLLLAATIVATGCSKDEPKLATSIIGHTFRADEGSNYVSFYFAPTYTCVYTSQMDGEYMNVTQLTYRISSNNVDVYFDNSTTWIESKRGTLFLHLVYYFFIMCCHDNSSSSCFVDIFKYFHYFHTHIWI